MSFQPFLKFFEAILLLKLNEEFVSKHSKNKFTQPKPAKLRRLSGTHLERYRRHRLTKIRASEYCVIHQKESMAQSELLIPVIILKFHHCKNGFHEVTKMVLGNQEDY